MYLVMSFVIFAVSSAGAFAIDDEFQTEEYFYEADEIYHEMQLGCVATKKECISLAQQSGYAFVRVFSDRARCPERRKPRACIVQH